MQNNSKLFKPVKVKQRTKRKSRTVKVNMLIKNFYLPKEAKLELLENMLVRQKPQVLSKIEKKVLKVVCKTELPEKYRKHLWLRASGGLASMNIDRNYYKNLKNS